VAIKRQESDVKHIKLVGGPYDGELLVDNFQDALDRQGREGGPLVRYYRDPSNASCFLVDDHADSRLLVYRARDFSARMERRDRELEMFETRLAHLEKLVTGILLSQPYRKTLWERVSDAWKRAE
jgi:hypothetical protein